MTDDGFLGIFFLISGLVPLFWVKRSHVRQV